MTRLIAGMTMSVDRFVADRQGGIEPLYPDLEALHGSACMEAMIAETGAVVMGRRALVPAMGGIMGGMEKTTVYLTAGQKEALSRAAQAEGRSEARLIREGVERVIAQHRIAEAATPLADAGPVEGGRRDGDVARRPRWISRDEFVRVIVARPADAGLRAELLALSPDTTDEVDPG